MPLRLRQAPDTFRRPGYVHAMRKMQGRSVQRTMCGRDARKWRDYASQQPRHINCGICLELMASEAAS